MSADALSPAVVAAGEMPTGGPRALLHEQVAGYALARELIAPRQIAEGDLVIRNLSSRNRVYAVESREGPSWLLKQGVERSGWQMVANEARAYGALHSLGPAVRRHLPEWRGYDERNGVLALGLMKDALSLRAFDQRTSRTRRTPVGPARLLGRALGLVHRMTMREDMETDAAWTPAALGLHRPGVELLHEGSTAAIELVKIVQRTPGFAERLEELRLQWRVRAFVHLDMKWDNCLLWGPRHRRIALIDWEAACLGDPCWDIGSALSHYLSAWVFSVPVTGPTPPERFAQLAARPLDTIQPAIRACWQEYARELDLPPASAIGWLLQTVRFAAARLVLTAFETAQASTQLTGPLLLHLQLAYNMLERPHESAVHLLGIPLDGRDRT
jgi:hypothetical protein